MSSERAQEEEAGNQMHWDKAIDIIVSKYHFL